MEISKIFDLLKSYMLTVGATYRLWDCLWN